MDVPYEVLDREIAAAARAVVRARRELREGSGQAEGNSAGVAARSVADPLAGARRVSTRTAYLELAERAPKDPLAAALGAWVAELTVERVTWADTVRFESAWHNESVAVAPEKTRAAGQTARRVKSSPRAVFGRLLREPVDARRRELAQSLAEGATAVADAARILAERRAEAERLLGGVAGAAALADPPELAAEVALAVLDRTEPLAEALASERGRAGAWSDALSWLLARDAGEGWPAHLGARWVHELFRGTPLFDGLALSIPGWPAPLGAASFARSLAGVGAALADVDVPRAAPRSLARPPGDLLGPRRAALFASIVAEPAFNVRALGLGRGRARDQSRKIAGALLVSLRLDAARAALGGALLLPARDRADRFEGLTARALGAPAPASLAGVLPRLGPGDPARVLGAVLAAADRRRLIEGFDEDWWRSPHAALALRDEHAAVPAAPKPKREQLFAALDDLMIALQALAA